VLLVIFVSFLLVGNVNAECNCKLDDDSFNESDLNKFSLNQNSIVVFGSPTAGDVKFQGKVVESGTYPDITGATIYWWTIDVKKELRGEVCSNRVTVYWETNYKEPDVDTSINEGDYVEVCGYQWYSDNREWYIDLRYYQHYIKKIQPPTPTQTPTPTPTPQPSNRYCCPTVYRA